ncbi:PTS sugar transporter subunit IIC [Listeria monocytogenes]|uniref:PTS sugar transporter subunit IIC n=1 Tax=Listeria monocytogenes TaxID=1639 RepID=UPI00086D5979|nr:PTS sugar transporter subunit IIC [Listeria monocytogenes]EAG6834130.1 PTS sugar transporter subunit IIC [Listeria monocytogenes]OEO58517.1 PTS lactose transporter subunit IIC [Listeria monocytogenes]
MNGFIAFMEKYFIPYAAKIGGQRHLVAIRDGFITTMPLMILGSFAVLINNFPIPAYQKFMNNLFGEGTWQAFGGNVWNGTFAILALLIAFTVAYNLAKSYDKDPLSSAVVSVATFFTIGAIAPGADGIANTGGLGSTGLFLALIIAILSTEIFTRLSGSPKLIINMPDGVPPAVSRSFAALFPAMITVSIFGLITAFFQAAGVTNLVISFYELVQEPFMGLANSLPAALLLAFVSAFLWFFGLHGANIIDPFMQTINIPAIEANVKALEAGKELPYIVNKPFFDSFVNLGGTGATIGLIIAIFIVARKHKAYMKVSKLSAAPGIFNINEPMMFGLPIVLNPIMFIPYILAPLVLVTVAYFATAIGWVPACTIVTPWTTPPIIGGALATQSIAGGVLAAVNLGLSILIFLPFAKIAQIQELRREKEALAAEGVTAE